MSFRTVKTLRVEDGLDEEIARCLQLDDGELPLDLQVKDRAEPSWAVGTMSYLPWVWTTRDGSGPSKGMRMTYK
jgi:hypothetical protein